MKSFFSRMLKSKTNQRSQSGSVQGDRANPKGDFEPEQQSKRKFANESGGTSAVAQEKDSGRAAFEGGRIKAKSGKISSKFLELPYMEFSYSGKDFRYASTGKSSVKRLRSLFQKEPITIFWIDNFSDGDVLFDVGANVGMYSIYAGVAKRSRVFSFEPEALNFAELNKNIFLNGLHGQVTSYCLAISDKDKIDKLLLSDFGLGISYHDFEENSWDSDKQFAADWFCKKEGRLEQGCIGRQIDTLVSDIGVVPDHIKIDVDGLEHRVLGGMLATIKNPAIKTILIEINFDNPKNLEIIEIMEKNGWRFSWDQIRCTRAHKFTIDQIKEYQRAGKGGLNYIFFRDNMYDELFKEFFDQHDPTKYELIEVR